MSSNDERQHKPSRHCIEQSNFNLGLLLNLTMPFETASQQMWAERARPLVQLLIRASWFIFGQVIFSFPI